MLSLAVSTPIKTCTGAAVVDHTGHVLGTEAFSTTRSGYRAMLVWLRSKGDVCRVGTLERTM